MDQLSGSFGQTSASGLQSRSRAISRQSALFDFLILVARPAKDALGARHHLRIEFRIDDAALLLADVVVERDEGELAQKQNGDKVDDGHERHEEVGEVPDEAERGDGAEINHHHDEGAVDPQRGRMTADEVHVDFAVEVVADDGAEGEEENRNAHEGIRPFAELAGERLLDERNAGLAGVGPARGEQHEHGGGSANDQRVEVDAERLHEALLGGMGCVGSGGGVRNSTHAGFVGEEAALDAGHESHAEAGAQNGVEVEGAAKDGGEHFGKKRDVHHRDGQRHEDVGASHDRDHHADHLGDAVEAAEDHESRDDGDGEAGRLRVKAERSLHGEADRIGLNGIEDQAVGDGEQNGEDGREERGAENVVDVVGRAAHEAAALARSLVDLGERGFDEARGGADRGDDPHPEDGARAARGNRNGNAGDVADAYAGGGRNAEGLEG